MNWFVMIQAALCLGASAFELARGNGKLCVVYAAWAVSNAAMAFMGDAR